MTALLTKPRLQIFLFVLVLTVVLFWQARGAMTPFIIGLVLAYLILPLVSTLNKHMPQAIKKRKMARPLAIVFSYLIVILSITAFSMLIVPPVIEQFAALYNNVDDLYTEGYDQASLYINEGLNQYEQLPPEIRLQIEAQLGDFNPTTVLNPVFAWVRNAATSLTSTVSNTVGFIVSLLIIPFWLFFVLNDDSSVLRRTIDVIPSDLRPDVEAVRIIFDRVLSGYIRGQLIVATALGVVITIGLLILDVPYALVLGILAGLLALIPFIGAVIGAFPAILVALVTQGIQGALAVAVLFIVVQQIDNIFFSPKIIGDAVALHPALIMVVIVVGSSLFGALGALIAVPATAILRDIAHYFYIRADEAKPSPTDALAQVGYGADVSPTLRAMERRNRMEIATVGQV